MPSFGALHPALVHFPIGILTVVPVLLLLGICNASRRRGIMLATAVVLLTGTVASWVTVFSGEYSVDVVKIPVDAGPGVGKAIHEHEESAEFCRNIFTALTILYGLLVFTPPAFKWLRTPKGTLTAQLVFLVLYLVPLYLLLRVGHLGGRLVHLWGLHVPIK